MEYAPAGNGLAAKVDVADDYRVVIAARDIRAERTGPHARISILLNHVTLAWGRINIEKSEDRIRLANAAYKHIAPEYRQNGLAEYPDSYLRKDLDDFCEHLWETHLEQFEPVLFNGDADRTGPSWQIMPYVVDGAGTIIFGPPGRGKSYTMLLMAVALDAGLTEGVPWPCEQQRDVLIVNLERSAKSLAQRIGNVNQCLGLQRSRPLHVINARGRSLENVKPAIDSYIEKTFKALKPTLFVDSLSRAGAGDMNANDNVNRIVDMLNSWDTWVALGHTPRGDESHIFGSQMFDAAADITVRLTSQQEDRGPLGIGLELDKRNDVGRARQEVIALEFDDYGLARIRPARANEFADVEASRKTSTKDQIKDYLRSCPTGTAHASEIADELNIRRETVVRHLATSEFTMVRKDGRYAYYGIRANV